MSNIIPFTYEDQPIRIIMQNGEPWWVAADVCGILDIQNVSQAVESLEEDEKNTLSIREGIRGNPNKLCVNEPGLYSLIFISRKPEAKTFRRWITHEVLPTIRKTGTYSVQPQPLQRGSIGEIVSDPKRLGKYIYHLQGLQDVLYPEYIEQQPLAPEEQLKQDVLRILKNAGKPLTPSMLRYSYFKSTPKEALYRACEELAVAGQLHKEITGHAPEGRYSVA
jgi:hypothetical protein